MKKHGSPLLLLILGLTMAGLWASAASAAPPWSRLVPFRRVEADPSKRYYLTEENGPWLILAATFSGAEGEQQAHDLVLELRRNFKLPAYIHKRHYDYTESVAGLGFDKDGIEGQVQRKKMRYLQDSSFDAIAVMVGDYESVEDGGAQKALDKIKYAQPACLDLTRNKSSQQRFVGLREWQKKFFTDNEKRKMGPMRMAFLTRNPMLPEDAGRAGGVDEFVLRMNRGVENSLLNCPGKYTVRVATFRGVVTQDPKTIAKFQNGGQFESKLDDAAQHAHQLTMSLRRRKIEAYEFHDRYESIVTVGSFDWAAQPGNGGRQQINPAIHQLIEKFKGRPRQVLGRQTADLQPLMVDNLPCDIQPIPIQVPRQSASAVFSASHRSFR